MSATTLDQRNVCEPSTDPAEKYREIWAGRFVPPTLPPFESHPARTVELFTTHRVYRLTPGEAVALAAQLNRAAAGNHEPEPVSCLS